jgi:hypothetical protein
MPSYTAVPLPFEHLLLDESLIFLKRKLTSVVKIKISSKSYSSDGGNKCQVILHYLSTPHQFPSFRVGSR